VPGISPPLRSIKQIATLLQDPACRLLTLVGPGGIGKTRLALALAEGEVRFAPPVQPFPEGIWVVALTAVNAPEFLAATMAKTLSLTLSGASEPKEQLLNQLREKKLLWVLDNFEHLVEGAGLVTEMLQCAPAVKVLVTARERLNVQGEWVFEVQGLPVPGRDQTEHLEEYRAVALFVQSAQRWPGRCTMSKMRRPSSAGCAWPVCFGSSGGSATIGRKAPPGYDSYWPLR
jgi:predicted ATPase